MPSRRCLWIIVCLSATHAGCAQSGPLLSQGAGVGTLKTSLSHMEYENQQLRRENASLKAEVRETEDRLVQEESANGELTSRLDNAMVMLKGRGLGGTDVAETNPNDPGPERPRTTLPAGRSSRKARKPPFARIPGQLDLLPPSSDGDQASLNGWGSSGLRGVEDADPPGSRDQPVIWLPVARGSTEPAGSRR